MTLRDLTTVALRILALGLMFSALGLLVTLAYVIVEISIGGPSSPWNRQIVPSLYGTGFAAFVRACIGCALFVFASRVARLICRGVHTDEATALITSIGAGDAYHIATFVMGVYFVARAVSPSALAIVGMMRAGVPTASSGAAASALEAILYIAIGLGLILGSRGIARSFAALGHDPDNIPAQQISLRHPDHRGGLCDALGARPLLGSLKPGSLEAMCLDPTGGGSPISRRPHVPRPVCPLATHIAT